MVDIGNIRTMEKVLEMYGKKVEPIEVYRDIFKLGEGYIQKKNEPAGLFKTNPLGLYSDDLIHFKYRIMFEDTFEEDLAELQKHKLGLLNGITYFGKKNTAHNASKMYAMIFDLDNTSPKLLANFLFGAIEGHHYPIPNYIVLSGHGVHLYYVFEFPISLYPNIKTQLKEFKYKLIERIWNRYTSKSSPQYQGIFQPFRVIGGKTKDGTKRKITKAYDLNTHPIILRDFNEFVPAAFEIDDTKLYRENKYTLAEAKIKFPEWYERVVINNIPSTKKWHIKKDLYNWWLRKISTEATFGHRYFCIMALAIYAIKCDVPLEEAKKDAYSLVPYFKTLTNEQDFGEIEVESAFECYDYRYTKFPRKDIEKLTSISMPANPRRNYREQNLHLEMARAIRDINCKYNNRVWNNTNGAPTKEHIVHQYQQEHPNCSKRQCAKDTGLSKNTVKKWWINSDIVN